MTTKNLQVRYLWRAPSPRRAECTSTLRTSASEPTSPSLWKKCKDDIKFQFYRPPFQLTLDWFSFRGKTCAFGELKRTAMSWKSTHFNKSVFQRTTKRTSSVLSIWKGPNRLNFPCPTANCLASKSICVLLKMPSFLLGNIIDRLC